MMDQIQDDFRRTGNLHMIGLIDFCYILIKNIKKFWYKNPLDENLVGMLCQIFDCVDVDSRGIIDWDDFVSFALRSGRNRFKAVSGYSNIEYVQRTDVPIVVPQRQLYYCGENQTLFAFEGDSPILRIFRKSGELVGNFNPTASILRMMRVRAQGKRPYYAEKKASKINAGKINSSKNMSESRGSVTAIVFVERKRQIAIATSDCILSFWNSRLQHLVDFVDTQIPQMGMVYCSKAEVLISWPGDSADFNYRVWDINTRMIKFLLPLHSAMILKTMEVKSMGLMVSSSMDRTLIVWPSSLLLKYDTPDFEEFKSEFESIPLTGQLHAIRSLAYAPHNELILGAGFDYDVYAWDPTTKTLHMKLIGHRHSVVGVAVIYNPLERAATVDEAGSVKIWNIDRSQGFRAQHLQSISTQAQSEINVIAFAPISAHGGTLAVLAERLYLFDLLGGGLEDSRSVTGGLIIAEQIGKLYVVGRKLAFETALASGQVGKVYDIISDERTDSCTTIRVTSRISSNITKVDKIHENHNLLHSDTTEKHSSLSSSITNQKDISVNDDITSATMDNYGKKMFIGTHSGKILLLDTTTMGILNHLTFNESESSKRENQGPVVKMKYCSQNELLVVAHANGAIKIFSGCHRTITTEQREKYLVKKNYKEWCPYSLGGNTPSSPLLLRSNQMVHETSVLSMAVSEELGLIAVSGSDGTVRVIDLYTLLVRSIYSVPYISRQSVECVHLTFIPGAPLLLGADSHARLTLWTTYPLTPSWVFTWALSHGSLLFHEEYDDGDNGGTSIFDSGLDDPIPEQEDDNYENIIGENFELEDDSGIAITSLECILWKNNEIQKYSTSDSSIPSSRAEWTLLVGDSSGRVTLLDITDILERIGIHDFAAIRQTSFLHRNFSPFYQCRRRDIKDGIEEFQIKELIKLLKHPIGMLGMNEDASNGTTTSSSKVGYKGVTIKDIKRRARWGAHLHSVSEIKALQHSNTTTSINSFDNENNNTTRTAPIRRKMSTMNKFSFLGHKPYAIITLSEYGISKKWSWKGLPLDDDLNIDSTNSLAADFHNLFSALNNSASLSNDNPTAMMNSNSMDGGGGSMLQIPTGASQERINNILKWILLPLTEYYNTRVSYLKPALIEIKKNPLLVLSRNRGGTERPSTADSIKQRKSSISELLWSNNFLNNGNGGGTGGTGQQSILSDNDSHDTSISSIPSLISNGLEKSHPPLAELTSEELHDENIEKIRQNARNAGISGNDLNIFVREIATIKKKVDHLKERQEYTLDSWNSKIRFPNLENENIRKESHLTNKISDLMSPHTQGQGTQAYEIFLQEREILLAKTFKKSPQQLLKKTPPSSSHSTHHPHPSSSLQQFDNSDFDERRVSVLTSIRHSEELTQVPSTSNNLSNNEKNSSKFITTKPSQMIKEDEDDDADSIHELKNTISSIDLKKSSSSPSHINTQECSKNIQKTLKKYNRLMRIETATIRTRSSIIEQKTTTTIEEDEDNIRKKKNSPKKENKSKPREALSGTTSSESTKKHDINVHGRYGPYKIKDIIAFEEFMSRLPVKARQMDPESTEKIISDYFPDTMAMMQLNTPYDQRELANFHDVAKNKSISRLISSIRDRKDGIIVRGDIFGAFFPFASEAEKVRIYTFSIVRAVLFEVLKSLKPIQSLTTFSHDESQVFTSPNDKYRMNAPMIKNTNPLKRGQSPNSLFGTTSPPRTTMKIIRRKNSGIEGWKLEKWIFDDLKKFFDDLYNDMNGTVLGSEVIDIIQSSSVITSLDRSPNLTFLAMKRNFPLNSEMNGNQIGIIFEDILKIDIVEETARGIEQKNDRSYLDSPKRAIQLKRLYTRSFETIMQEDTSTMDVGTVSSSYGR